MKLLFIALLCLFKHATGFAQLASSEYTYPNPNYNNFIIGSNAFPLSRGELRYQSGLLLFNTLDIGTTNHFSTKIGFLLPIFGEGSGNFFVNPRLLFPVEEEFYIGIGNYTLVIENGFGTFFYGTATVGNKSSHVSLSFGYGLAEGDFSEQPIVSIAAQHRLTDKLALITENWYSPTNDDDILLSGIYSYGIRLINKRVTFDFIFANNDELVDAFPIGIPLINFTTTFGKRDKQ
ncbi:MAG: hypothetical protein AAGD05_02540 [Bacteroidota bacterium]